jgi:hypothetical protein
MTMMTTTTTKKNENVMMLEPRRQSYHPRRSMKGGHIRRGWGLEVDRRRGR